MNFYILFLSALIPLVVGAIYYNPAVFGKAWMKAAGVTEDKLKTGNMALIFGLTYVFSLIISLFMSGYAIHQNNMDGLFLDSERFNVSAAEAEAFLTTFKEKYSHLHRTFSHGAVHGGISAIFFALPLMAIVSLFERRNWKYILIHTGYWFITLVLMGGFICAYL